MRMVDDLIKIVNAGGEMVLDDGPIMTNDLIRIAFAGQGNVIFDFN